MYPTIFPPQCCITAAYIWQQYERVQKSNTFCAFSVTFYKNLLPFLTVLYPSDIGLSIIIPSISIVTNAFSQWSLFYYFTTPIFVSSGHFFLLWLEFFDESTYLFFHFKLIPSCFLSKACSLTVSLCLIACVITHVSALCVVTGGCIDCKVLFSFVSIFKWRASLILAFDAQIFLILAYIFSF